MTPPGTTLRNLRVADECTWAAIFEKSRTKDLRRSPSGRGQGRRIARPHLKPGRAIRTCWAA